jgi:hypothetical protein
MNSSAFTESHQAVNIQGHADKSQIENINEEYLMRNASRNNKKVTFPDERQTKLNNYKSQQQDEEYLDDVNDQSFASVTTTTSSIVGDKVIKRKISRFEPYSISNIFLLF